eukprot:TRINITY_DN5024_c0_g1_i1.p1 TRINITY_DN5024_c0_g1~~TRINITY_DN5024_c0_g1_i1.p1  ORF type:complete len:207 (-),score=47.02 TRINITY_DN5024_c0_g1_i1:139-759(-)
MSTVDHSLRYIDPDTGYLMEPGTQRPDGTWRKPRRVKDGYIPQDEVPLYESKGKTAAKAREAGYIPGLHNPNSFKIDTFVLPAPTTTIPGLNMAPDSGLPSTSSAKSKKKKNKTAKSDSQVKDVTDKMQKTSLSDNKTRKDSCGQQPVATDPAKKLRNLKKKLRDIQVLEEKLNSGEIPNPEKEQLDKVARKHEVEREIEQLERSM